MIDRGRFQRFGGRSIVVSTLVDSSADQELMQYALQQIEDVGELLRWRRVLTVENWRGLLRECREAQFGGESTNLVRSRYVQSRS